MSRWRSLSAWTMALAFALLSEPAVLACTACFGKSDSNMAKGMNMGIFVLLFVITSVLCGVAGFFVFLAKRSNELQNGEGPRTIAATGTNS